MCREGVSDTVDLCAEEGLSSKGIYLALVAVLAHRGFLELPAQLGLVPRVVSVHLRE